MEKGPKTGYSPLVKKIARVGVPGLGAFLAALAIGMGIRSCNTSEDVYLGKTSNCDISLEVYSKSGRNTRKDLTAECGQFSITYIDTNMDSTLDAIIWEEDGLDPLEITEGTTDPFEKTLFDSATISYAAFLDIVQRDLDKKMKTLPSIIPVEED